ncbi:AC58/59 [Alphabaculovirus altermyunipunctae]|uniref:AC58/59 n=1 Tax=Mythimna unipuncta nucleopolyhedrovirus TaxID=447897 RepID=A0A346TPJ1_9ABAC|nr:AC58/59 [Mythimna unipuncta nucleopolyhedrovirus]AXU41501.1 AC58/59 [Mythimna unipuncta nucleopolyhedrovirus]
MSSVNYSTENPFVDPELPLRAKRLFAETFRKHYHPELNNEHIAINAAWDAVNKRYVKLNNSWMPNKAATIIVKHNLHESNSTSSSDDEGAPIGFQRIEHGTKPLQKDSHPVHIKPVGNVIDYDEQEEEENRENLSDSTTNTSDDEDNDYKPSFKRTRFDKLNHDYSFRKRTPLSVYKQKRYKK